MNLKELVQTANKMAADIEVISTIIDNETTYTMCIKETIFCTTREEKKRVWSSFDSIPKRLKFYEYENDIIVKLT